MGSVAPCDVNEDGIDQPNTVNGRDQDDEEDRNRNGNNLGCFTQPEHDEEEWEQSNLRYGVNSSNKRIKERVDRTEPAHKQPQANGW